MLRWEELKEKLAGTRLWKSSVLEPAQLRISSMFQHYLTSLWHEISYSSQQKLAEIFEKLQINPELSDDVMGACEVVSLIGLYAFFLKKPNVFKKLLSVYNFTEKYKSLRVKMKNGVEVRELSNEERVIAELIPFIEPAENIRHYPYIADQKLMEAHIDGFTWVDRLNLRKRYFSNVNNTAFQEQGGLITMTSWIGVYDRNDIVKYLRVLSSALSRSQVDVVFQLSGEFINIGLHAVSLCYHAKTRSWSLVDANYVDEADVDVAENVMADKLIRSFSVINSSSVIVTRVICLGKDKDELNDVINDVFSDPVFFEIHDIKDSVIKKSDQNIFNLLQRASLSGFAEVINGINRNHSITNANDRLESSILLAIMNGNYQCVSPLVEAGVDVNVPCGGPPIFKGFTPIHYSVVFEAPEVVLVLTTLGVDVNVLSSNGVAPLHVAAMMGRSRVISPLVESGAYVNMSAVNSLTPLHFAAMCGHSDVIKCLAKFGADVDKVNDVGCAPIHYAIMAGCLETVQALADVGADLNVVVRNMGSLLSLAVLEGHPDIVKFLLKRNVDMEIAGIFSENELIKEASRFDMANPMKLLIAQKKHEGATSDKISITAYELACVRGDKKMIAAMDQSRLDASRRATRKSSLGHISIYSSSSKSSAQDVATPVQDVLFRSSLDI